MADPERPDTPLHGGVFYARSEIMNADGVRRALWRMSHEILEQNRGLSNLVLVGLETGGVHLARKLAENLLEIEKQDVPVGTLNVAFYRDDIGIRQVIPGNPTELSFDLSSQIVVLVDDVLFTGRTIRAAMDAIVDFGRPAAVQLAVMIDRGHRELPIRPDYVGKNVPTRRDEVVDVTESGVLLGVMGGVDP
ncbi:MAG: bifunctional pyr operon transcriptional regulator/uracil phosphoribosyltransferase [Acidimicrobiaceae bacterium]|jgi:pyrimidine operon attenuation protein/uracil phosphoribosyltransferase|nr:bifunctional pyr operon transcriptional regulator/uracil phosphoribosyltransferase [Acidimicrobiaceae bacterium]|tara:strand:+ start:120820 stop:121395 length:576 start_codon:yes stop_codon:yes gene_type:complete